MLCKRGFFSILIFITIGRKSSVSSVQLSHRRKSSSSSLTELDDRKIDQISLETEFGALSTETGQMLKANATKEVPELVNLINTMSSANSKQKETVVKKNINLFSLLPKHLERIRKKKLLEDISSFFLPAEKIVPRKYKKGRKLRPVERANR